MSVPKVKGSLMLETKRAIRRDYGDEALERVITGCSPETQQILRGAVLSNLFYPETVLGELLAAATGIIGRESYPAYARKMAKLQVNGVLKFFLRVFVSPRKLSENNDKLWRALHDTGNVEVTHGADNRSHTLKITGFVFPNPEYEKSFVEFHCGVLELTGAKNVTGVSAKSGPDSYVQKYYWE